jgi:prepilin-type N-terminal cleavage/methylation domain-containing protein
MTEIRCSYHPKNLCKGFTFFELIIVMVIAAVIGTYTTISLQKSILHNQLQKASFEMMTQLSSMRPLALKNDARVLVRFCAEACSVFVDTSGDTVAQAGEFSYAWEVKKNVLLGLPSGSSPSSAPPGSQLPASGSVAAGQWSNMFVVDNDALGSINSGCLYLHSPKLTDKAYCITSFGSQTLKIFSWSGGTWSAQ